MSMPDWGKHLVDKIWDELQLAPDERSACCLLFSLLHAFHTQCFTDGDRQAAALELAEQFTELAAELAAREAPLIN